MVTKAIKVTRLPVKSAKEVITVLGQQHECSVQPANTMMRHLKKMKQAASYVANFKHLILGAQAARIVVPYLKVEMIVQLGAIGVVTTAIFVEKGNTKISLLKHLVSAVRKALLIPIIIQKSINTMRSKIVNHAPPGGIKILKGKVNVKLATLATTVASSVKWIAMILASLLAKVLGNHVCPENMVTTYPRNWNQVVKVAALDITARVLRKKWHAKPVNMETRTHRSQKYVVRRVKKATTVMALMHVSHVRLVNIIIRRAKFLSPVATLVIKE